MAVPLRPPQARPSDPLKDEVPVLWPHWGWLNSASELLFCGTCFSFLICRLALQWGTGCGVGMMAVSSTALSILKLAGYGCMYME